MSRIIVSYDDTPNDQDALVLAHQLATATGAQLTLAYVNHTADGQDHGREMLRRGAESIGLDASATRIFDHVSTGEGLRQLAEQEHADLVVLGSEYRTPAGSVRVGTTTQKLIDGGPVAVAVAPAGYRDHPVAQAATVAVIAEGEDSAAAETASALAAALGGSVAESGKRAGDLLVIGSRPETSPGRVRTSAVAEYAIETARCPVVVVARQTPVRLGAPARV